MTNMMLPEKAERVLTTISEYTLLIPKVGLLVWVAIVLSLLLPVVSAKSKKCQVHHHRHEHGHGHKHSHSHSHGHGHRSLKKQRGLFPNIESAVIAQELPEIPVAEAFPQPCSTGLTTRLLPFKNAKGEIEWVFTDDIQPGKELHAFKANPGTFKATPQLTKNAKIEKNPDILSPVTSNSSNNESLPEKKVESAVSPQINTPSSTSSEDHKEEIDDGEGESSVEGEGGSTIHECPHCEAKFRMRGYLTRHLKKHMPQKAYQCPFHAISLYKDENDNMHQCHPSGGFSRRDTYKTHLKTRHFKFPAGTPIKGRSQSPGNCAMCGAWFQNAEIWSEIHIEGAECKYLPAGFQGKSRIKNKLKKQMARLMREEKKSKSRAKKSSTYDYLSPSMGTPNMTNTPSASNPSQYDYEDSPTHSSCSSIGPQRSIPVSFHDQFQRENSQRLMYVNSPMSEHNLVMTPNFQADDYDDEYCLDTEQMSIFAPTSQYNGQLSYHGAPQRTPEHGISGSNATENPYAPFIR